MTEIEFNTACGFVRILNCWLLGKPWNDNPVIIGYILSKPRGLLWSTITNRQVIINGLPHSKPVIIDEVYANDIMHFANNFERIDLVLFFIIITVELSNYQKVEIALNIVYSRSVNKQVSVLSFYLHFKNANFSYFTSKKVERKKLKNTSLTPTYCKTCVCVRMSPIVHTISCLRS